ncbi:nucleotidyl transferase AbiEii/AbiGii toxin family protein [Desulfonatronum thioautotrophicum]|uniref:nucleotidyl transferase AbiEii/AbiGii toxin family protein n=1 Tax=Desulfonatronum thioautotrophicum TaxID=617001 RepID=UPI00069BDCB4|nr:nucleotidyl transferase AbiEii/AbiGii toxin family protein [Desulfonatronum thioautotrophicum]
MMPDAIVQLFEEYLRKNHNSTDRALAETIQAIALLGLSRTDFFTHAAFYGGTALRLLYNLDRFSEDLDFSLLQPQETFRLAPYLEALRDEMEAFGFSVDIGEREKEIVTPIHSAFIKANTRIHVIQAGAPVAIAERIHKNAVCKVKLEVDTDPPPHAEYHVGYLDDPVPFSIRAYSGPSLLAGKMDAVLFRGWRTRIKGRDWYDFAFLVRKDVPLLLPHLEARLRQRGAYTDLVPLTKDHCSRLIASRIEAVDFAAAKADVAAFVRQPRDLDVWSREYFHHVLDKLRFLPE